MLLAASLSNDEKDMIQAALVEKAREREGQREMLRAAKLSDEERAVLQAALNEGEGEEEEDDEPVPSPGYPGVDGFGVERERSEPSGGAGSSAGSSGHSPGHGH